MGFEAQKTNRVRGAEFLKTYFAGRVLDIGCGPDLVVPHAIPFDLADGDANRILDYLPTASFDCVHSSHCLEHMNDVSDALSQWWDLVKPGGYMVLVVPDEDLYEQGYWPSLFNADHKATFRLDQPTSWSKVSHDLRFLVERLPNCNVLDLRRQDDGYDHSLRQSRAQTLGRFLTWFQWRRRGALAWLHLPSFEPIFDRVERMLGKPVEQTGRGALAQIQAVLRKSSPAVH